MSENNDKIQILKVLVGSQAHGLATPESDFDYRGVFVAPTRALLTLGTPHATTTWIEGKEDNTSWEIGHFLHLATKCNPTILETFLAPVVETTPWGTELRALFPHVWNSTDVMNAFIGYGHNQRKKFLEDKDQRALKYATAYARTLINAWELLTSGTFTVAIINRPEGDFVARIKRGEYTAGEVIDFCREWEEKVRTAYATNPDKKTDLNEVNKFLLSCRLAEYNSKLVYINRNLGE
jgi:predicted nucleotidyltransferase